MVIVWPMAVRRLRETAAHYTRRLKRMETVAIDGRRVNYGSGDNALQNETFPFARAKMEGKAEAFAEALQIIRESAVELDEKLEVDLVVVTLAQSGLDVEAIAARCGLTILEVATALALYVKLAEEEAEDASA